MNTINLKIRGLAVALLAILFLAGCAQTPIGSRDYSLNQARTAGSVQPGVVVGVRPVQVHEDPRRGQRGELGSIVGAAGGAVIGRQIGGGSGRDLATLAGAVIGGGVGSRVDQRFAAQSALEVQVRLDNGRMVAVTQGADQGFRPGQRVSVVRHGRTVRVTQ